MLALIFTRKLRPMIIGSSSRWLMFGRDDGAAARHFVADELGRQPFADGDELHLRRDLALARVVQLRDRLAGARRAARPPPTARAASAARR